MIEDKKDGIKIAENPEEAFWNTLKERCNKSIMDCEHEITVQKHILTLCSDMLKTAVNKH